MVKMSKRTLVIAIGDESTFVNSMKDSRVPFLRMQYPRVRSKQKMDSEVQEFVDRVSNIMCPSKNPGAEECFVLLTGIRGYSDFSYVLENLTERCEYHIIYFASAQVKPDELAKMLKKHFHNSAHYEHIPGVTFCRASDKTDTIRLRKAS